ncbi:MAG: hypothetical protein FH753_14680 [Firmicutes bacterium]|nr:hypothetical protein [Bacillota bacterium]
MSEINIIGNPNFPEDTKDPTLPLVVVLRDGKVGGTDSIKGAVSLIVGKDYLKSKDETANWYKRLFVARKESMAAIGRGIYAEVYDKRKGVIRNNYAVKPNDPDYEMEEDAGESEKIRIENGKSFLLSLANIKAIALLEREDSFQLRPHKIWDEINSGKREKQCKKCLHKYENLKTSSTMCNVFLDKVKNLDSKSCSSFTFIPEGYTLNIHGVKYVNLYEKYDVDDLMKYF